MNENNLWLKRWENREIGFHQKEVNPFLLKYFEQLALTAKRRVFVPLCGKTIDISWLLSKGFQVVGIELSEIAVKELFEELNITPSILEEERLICYESENLTVYVGDFFELTKETIGEVDAIYDRASMVALTKEVRVKYAKQLRELSNHAPQLLLSFEYEQSLMNRTPYSVDEEEIAKHYGEHYTIELLCREEIVGGFKGKIPACDVVWLLR